MPASSANEVSNTSTSYLLRSAQRVYIRISISAKSAASTPPAPERIVTTASRSSYSPLSSVRTSSSPTALRREASSRSASAIVSASASSWPSWTRTSSSSIRSYIPVTRSSSLLARDRRLVTSCACSGWSQRSGAPDCSSSSEIWDFSLSRSVTSRTESMVARRSFSSCAKSTATVREPTRPRPAARQPLAGLHPQPRRDPVRRRRPPPEGGQLVVHPVGRHHHRLRDRMAPPLADHHPSPGGLKVAAPVDVRPVRQRDRQATLDRDGDDGRLVVPSRAATDVLDLGGVPVPPAGQVQHEGVEHFLVGLPQRVQDGRLPAAERGDGREPEQDDHRDRPPHPPGAPPAPPGPPPASPSA